MAFTDRSELEDKLRKKLDKKRFRHTLGVAYTAAALAMKYGSDYDQAYLAGLLHDCAKATKTSGQIALAKELGVTLTDSEKKLPQLIHAKTGAYLAEHVYGVNDPEILAAIRTHTTGTPGMSLLQKILYIADYIEPNRDKQPRLAEIRREAFTDIDQCLFMILEDTVHYLQDVEPDHMDEETVRTYEYYKEKV